MVSEHLRRIALAQVERGGEVAASPAPELAALITRAQRPTDVHRALLKERPVLASRFEVPRAGTRVSRGRGKRAHVVGPTPQDLREEAAAVGLLDATPEDVMFRALFPTLDHGVYCAHHAMGKPSSALVPALEEHFGHLQAHGMLAWQHGWGMLRDAFRERVAEICGAELIRGDVARFESFSDGLSAIFDSGLEGRLLCGEDHFSTARYVHRWWGERTGSEVVELRGDRDGWVPTQHYLDALTPDTAVISLSSAHWRTGRLHDLVALRDAISDTCPDAVLLLDAYQTLGTVPFAVHGFPMRTAVMGGGVKQLHAGTGSGFAWISHTLLGELEPHRTGWFAHARPFDFAAPPLEPAHGTARWQTGAPDVGPMAALVTELGVLGTLGGGSVKTAVKAVRARTHDTISRGIKHARELGLPLVGEESADARAAFLAFRVSHGDALVARLAEEGVFVDHRADGPGAEEGLIRMSTSAASFTYELSYAIERLAHALR